MGALFLYSIPTYLKLIEGDSFREAEMVNRRIINSLAHL